MIPMMLTVFGPAYVFDYLQWSEIVVWLAVLAIVAGSIMALAQADLPKMLSYLVIAEVGYMVGGVCSMRKGLISVLIGDARYHAPARRLTLGEAGRTSEIGSAAVGVRRRGTRLDG